MHDLLLFHACLSAFSPLINKKSREPMAVKAPNNGLNARAENHTITCSMLLGLVFLWWCKSRLSCHRNKGGDECNTPNIRKVCKIKLNDGGWLFFLFMSSDKTCHVSFCLCIFCTCKQYISLLIVWSCLHVT